MKKFKSALTLFLCIIFVFISYSGGYFNINEKKVKAKIDIGSWRGDISSHIIDYLNNLKPTATRGGAEVSTLKNIADLFLDDAVYESSGVISGGTVKTEFANYPREKITELIKNASIYANRFLEFNQNNILSYKKQIPPTETLHRGALEKGSSKDFLLAMLMADLTDGYWSPATFSISIEGSGDISDYLIEFIYMPPENIGSMFSYHYRYIDTNYYNTTLISGGVDKQLNILSVTKGDYTDYISIKKKTESGEYISGACKHSFTQINFGTFSRFIKAAEIGIGKPIVNKYSEPEQTVEKLSDLNRAGLILIGKPSGNKIELRLSITDRGSWDRNGFEMLTIAVRVSRGIMNTPQGADRGGEPIIKYKAYSGDIWADSN